MLAYDWMWWGQLTNQNLVRRCAEVCAEVRGGVQTCMEVHGGVCGGSWRGVQRAAWRCEEVGGGVCGGTRRGVTPIN